MLFEECGLDVPEDVSVVGFDNQNHQYALKKKITTIEQDFYTIGFKAAEMLVGQIKGREPKNKILRLPVTMIEGDTVKNLNEAAGELTASANS
jgi:DNA-binding LacI/PurR family transcriptional regulator